MNTTQDPFWTDINLAMYARCMALAEQSNKSMSQSLLKNKKFKLPKCGFVLCPEAIKWIDLWKRYVKKLVTEEQVKYCFQLGFVPEYI